MKYAALLWFLLLVSACGGVESKDPVENGTPNSPNNSNAQANNANAQLNNANSGNAIPGALSGTIAGAEWTFASGYAADLFGDGELWVELHPTIVDDPCSRSFESSAFILMSVTGDPLSAPLSLDNNITFAHGDGQNDIATTGRLVINGIESGILSGTLEATMGEHEVSGAFAVPVCADR